MNLTAINTTYEFAPDASYHGFAVVVGENPSYHGFAVVDTTTWSNPL